MSLQELFDLISTHPFWVLSYLILIPLTALIAGWLGKGEGHLTPWKYLYAILIYLICIPGIFAVSLDVYQFLFDRRSILDANLFTQFLPILSMVITLLIIRRNVDLDLVPGFDKLGGLIMVLLATFGIMWIVDRTRIILFSYLQFQWVLLIFAALLVFLLFGWRRLVKS